MPEPGEAQWGRPDSAAPGREFSGRFKVELPTSMRREHITVDLAVDTAVGTLMFRRYTGRVRSLKNRRGRCEITAASGGFWLDRVRFEEVGVSYVDVAPSEVIWDVVGRAAASGVYDFLYADIEPVDGPKVRREEFLTITRIDKLSRPVGAAVEEAGLFFRDSPYNSPLCHRDRGPAEATDVLHEYVVGVHVDTDDFIPESTADDYYDVVMYTVDATTGAIDYPIDPILIPDSSAPLNAGYEIALSDESLTGPDDLYALGVKIASRLVHGESTVTFPVKFPHPLLVDGDFLSIAEPFTDDFRSGTRYWIAQVDIATERHDLTQELQLIMVQLREDEDTPPPVAAWAAPTRRGA